MRILFLDIDGVLNHQGTYKKCHETPGKTKPSDWLDRECIQRLNRVCSELGLSLVISSSWRSYLKFETLVEALRDAGLTAEVIGATPILEDPLEIKSGTRWSEILSWLQRNSGVTEWVILDDCLWEGFPPERFVRTTLAHGLTEKEVELVREVFCGKGNP